MIDGSVEKTDFRLWLASSAVIFTLHVCAGLLMASWRAQLPGDNGTEAIVVDLAPYTDPSSGFKREVAPGSEQQQAAPVRPPEEQKQDLEQKTELPDAPNAEVTLPKEELKKTDRPQEQAMPPAPVTTAPPPPRPSAAQLASWHRKIAVQLERHKNYPLSAQSRHESGVVTVAFTLDRDGRVLDSRVVHSSGFSLLDQETIATVKRAAPFPPPPGNLQGATFDFTVPIHFNFR